MSCTCAGTAPGYPQHEDWCGKPETGHIEGCVLDPEHEEPCLRAGECWHCGAGTVDGRCPTCSVGAA